MNYTLAVIDLQYHFGVEPNTPVVDNAEREIRQAVQDDAGVLLVEYEGCGPTLEQLTKLTPDYPNAKIFSITKRWDGGANEIIQAIGQYQLTDIYIKLAGINTDCCVYYTAAGLRDLIPHATVEIIADACKSFRGLDSHLRGLKSLKELGCLISNHP
jgi:hypothetical protein